jgi:hypothetical protein
LPDLLEILVELNLDFQPLPIEDTDLVPLHLAVLLDPSQAGAHDPPQLNYNREHREHPEGIGSRVERSLIGCTGPLGQCPAIIEGEAMSVPVAVLDGGGWKG